MSAIVEQTDGKPAQPGTMEPAAIFRASWISKCRQRGVGGHEDDRRRPVASFVAGGRKVTERFSNGGSGRDERRLPPAALAGREILAPHGPPTPRQTGRCPVEDLFTRSADCGD